jgi:site-specific DNA recombinase
MVIYSRRKPVTGSMTRRYLHQVLVIEELAEHGCRVEFVERPMSQDPNDQLLLQIRGAVAEYERTLITERLRRGRLARLRAGQLLPWIQPPFGYRMDPERPRDPAGLQRDAFAAQSSSRSSGGMWRSGQPSAASPSA